MLLAMALPHYNSDEILDAIERADYEFVLKNAMPYALAGNSDAQCTIALLYEAGWGVKGMFLRRNAGCLKQQRRIALWHGIT